MPSNKKLTTLVVMAAGIGSRFGGGIKQLEPVGPSGEIIIDYSVFDAVEAGFNRVMFIIRHDIEKDFKERIGYKIEEKLGKENVFYVYQETNLVNKKYSEKALARTKPFGTGHAVLMCRGALNTPFAVINADDYYGKEAYRIVHDYLVSSEGEYEYCMAGFRLGNTLSDNGGVTRGICSEDENGNMIKCVETKEIKKFGDITVIDDSYNASPDSVKASLDILSSFKGRKIAILADMLELGDYSPIGHKEVGAYAKEKGIDLLYCFGNEAKFIYEGFSDIENSRHLENIDEINSIIGELIKEGDTILIKGSRGMHTDLIVKKLGEIL